MKFFAIMFASMLTIGLGVGTSLQPHFLVIEEPL